MEGTYEMSAGRSVLGVGVRVYLTLHMVYFTLIFIDVCMGEGRTASWKKFMK